MTAGCMAEEDKKIALITGASKGIGAAIAKRLSLEGYHIWLNYRSDTAGAESVKQGIEKKGGSAELLQFDVADGSAVNDVLQPLLEKTVPDVLVNNAGFAKDNVMVFMSQEDWEAVTNVSLLGFFLVTKPVLFGMTHQRRGRIINIVSTAGQSGLPGQINYSAAKAGVIGATKSLAKEVVKRGILVNAVAPGFIDTGMLSELPREELLKSIPMGRPGKPEEVAGVVNFLCSDDAAYITGQVISVNGGMYM